MRQFKVQALPLEGHKYYRRAGFAWPRGEGYQRVEVLSDKDKRQPGTISEEGYLLVTEATYKVLDADKLLKVIPDGDPLSMAEHAEEVNGLRERIALMQMEHVEELKALRKRIGDLEASSSKSGLSKLEARIKELETENAKLKSAAPKTEGQSA